jgi:iron uptake system EfeUOB component EfeO/EfeM
VADSALLRTTLTRRFRYFIVTLLVVVLVSTALSFHAGYTTRRYRAHDYNPSSYPVHHVHPTAQQQAATLAVTDLFRREVVTASESFVSSSTHLLSDIRRGDLAAARVDELKTQEAFDQVRPSLGIGVTTLSPLDALVRDQAPGIAPTGLHAIERALWSGSTKSALIAAEDLVGGGPILEFGVSRTILTPSAICGRVDELLSWVVEDVIDSSQEQFSHVDMVDAKTTVLESNQVIGALVTLGRLVDNPLAEKLSENSLAMINVVTPISTVTADSHISAATWRLLAQRIDAVEGALGAMDGQLNGLGTGRPYA